MENFEIKQKLANTIRALSAEGVQAANSGHPGLPMGCADIASVLWSDVMNHNPADSNWFNRDRFILSAGHGSMLVYSLLHLYGYKVTLDDLKDFRQLHSITPGHPEYGHTDGVETTTGPLGQGFSNGVGMALASKMLAEKFNTPEHAIINNRIFVLCGDGCMMEGITSEAASTAGHLGLNNLVVIYDSNSITIEGSTDIAFTEDVGKRFEAYNWNVLRCDGHDMDAVSDAFASTSGSDKPTLIVATTTIGKGSPNKSGTHKIHGAPIGDEEIAATREALGLSSEAFHIDDAVFAFTKTIADKGAAAQADWTAKFENWSSANPDLKKAWDVDMNQELPELALPAFEVGASIASRKSSSEVLAALGEQIPFLYGGSADLDCSNLSRMPSEGDVNTAEFSARNLHFGVREHAMGAICNGLAIYGGIRPYCATFLVFSDYMRGAIRLAAIMKLPVIYIFTHDSIFVGEDGPTHQPIEHKLALEAIPGLSVIRPADATEVTEAWKVALANTDGPTALLLTRQNLETLETPANVDKGAYIISKESSEEIDLIFIASGSEVKIAMDAADVLEAQGKSVRVVSMPSTDIFDAQSADYKESVLPNAIRKRFALDFGRSTGWYKYIGLDGDVLAIDEFGICGPGDEVRDHFGFTTANVAEKAAAYLA
ncbi:MAG: transketolase [Lentisphaeria bacterium]|nr:transketolase [Lentisphaeria bacterium]NQZ67426.1 transketolase [Lentisphaeria bacterium]